MTLFRHHRSTRVKHLTGLGLAVLLSASCAATAAAKTASPPTHPPGISPFVPKGPKAARHIALRSAAIALINRADNHVYSTTPSCKPAFPRPSSSKPTHDIPGQSTLDAIAALRRQARPGDALPTGTPAGIPFGETYVDYTRSLTGADGTSFYLFVARSVPVSFRPSAACLDAEHAQLVKLLRGKARALRSTTLGEFAKLRRGWEQNAAAPTTPQDTLWFFSKGRGGRGLGGGVGGSTIADFLKYGMFSSSSSGRERSSTLSGLVPDGVATVTLEYPRAVSRGRWYKPAVFPSAYRRTVRVHENVLRVRVPRGPGDAFPARMVWRSADGKIVRVVKRPGL